MRDVKIVVGLIFAIFVIFIDFAQAAHVPGVVTGPSSSTTNGVCRYSDTTGKKTKNSGVTIDDSDNMSVPGGMTVVGSGEGRIDIDEGTCAVSASGVDSICANASLHALQVCNNAGACFTIPSSGGGAAYNGADLNQININTEFCEFAGAGQAGLFKCINIVAGGGGSGCASVAGGALPTVCAALVTSGAATGDGTMAAIADRGANGYSMLGDHTTVPWEAQFRFALNATSNMRARVGLMNTDTTINPIHGLFIRYDTNASFADTNFKFECRKASTSTVVDTTIAGDTNFHRLRVWSTVSGQVNFQLYNASGTLQKESLNACGSNTPVASLTAAFFAATDTTTSQTITIDAFGYHRDLTGVR